MATNIFDRLDDLAATLTQVAPPPPSPQGLELPPGAVGKWVIESVGAGFYALRAHYALANGDVIVGQPVRELAGRPQALEMALDFSVNLARATRLEWRRC